MCFPVPELRTATHLSPQIDVPRSVTLRYTLPTLWRPVEKKATVGEYRFCIECSVRHKNGWAVTGHRSYRQSSVNTADKCCRPFTHSQLPGSSQ